MNIREVGVGKRLPDKNVELRKKFLPILDDEYTMWGVLGEIEYEKYLEEYY